MDHTDWYVYQREKRLADDDTRTIVTGPLSPASRCLVCGSPAEVGPGGKYVKPGTTEPHVHGKTYAQLMSAMRIQEIREESWVDGKPPRKAKPTLKVGGKRVSL